MLISIVFYFIFTTHSFLAYYYYYMQCGCIVMAVVVVVVAVVVTAADVDVDVDVDIDIDNVHNIFITKCIVYKFIKIIILKSFSMINFFLTNF
jgi:hypothetical protein